MPAGQPDPPPVSGNSRLHGWKDISTHLGKSVRTVQRWEKELGLPVHRIHGVSGEIVFAHKHELDAWMQRAPHDATHSSDDENHTVNGRVQQGGTADAAQSSSHFSSHGKRWLAAAVLLLILGWGTSRIWQTAGRQGNVTGQPARLTLQENQLTVYDENDRVLWSKATPSVLPPNYYAKEQAGWNLAAIADLDGDGRKEIIVDRIGEGDHEILRVFDAAGHVNWSHWVTRTVQFGEERFGPPWPSHGFILVPEPDGTQSIWVRVMHNLWYPSLLQRIDAQGKVHSEYWSNGHIAWATPMTVAGKRRMYVGATNNDHRAATLAVLDYDHATGSAPANQKKYACMDCPSGKPLQFVVFQQMEISRALQSRPHADGMRLDGNGNILVNVFQGGIPQTNNPEYSAGVIYAVSPTGHVLQGETADNYRVAHSLLEGTGQLNHSFGVECEKQLFPALRWDGARFVPETGKLGSPPRQHATNLAQRKPNSRLSPAALR